MRIEAGEVIAAEFVRALRGRRSQSEFSRRLGYRSNIVRRWEARECWPTAAALLQAYVRIRSGVSGCFEAFFQRKPAWDDSKHAFAPAQIAAFLRDLKGRTPIGVIARQAGFNRYSVGRWLNGTANPKLPEFFCFVEAASRRLLDFIACFTDPRELPSLADDFRRLQLARRAAYDAPWSHAVLRALELEGYRRIRAARATAWLADHLGLPEAGVHEALSVLETSGQIRRSRGKWRVDRIQSVDTSADPLRAKKLKATWARVAIERLEKGRPGNFGYSLFAVSGEDLRRIRELHLEYVRAMQSLIAKSEPSECVALYCSQLLDLSQVENAFEVLTEPP